jgi:hypothetical protein
MRARISKVLAGGLVAAALTASIGGAAFAQSATPTPTGRPSMEQRAQEFLNALASKLGKSPTDITNAVKSVEKDRVAADLAAGRITQDQANQMNSRIDSSTGLPFGGGFGPGPGGHGGKGPRGFGPGADPAALATFLGVQPTDLRTGLQGKSLAAYAQEKGKTRDQLKAFLTQQEKSKLDQGVQAGRLTQAQEDQRLADLGTRLDQMIDRVGPPAGERGPGGPRGGQGPRGQGQGAPGAATTATPAARS